MSHVIRQPASPCAPRRTLRWWCATVLVAGLAAGLVAGLTLGLTLGLGAQSALAASGGPGPPPAPADDLTLEDIRDAALAELSPENALDYTAYPYLGWRTNGGPWFNECLDWLAAELKSFGFVEGKTAPGPHYWFEYEVRPGNAIWAPQYAALEIVGSAGDAVPGQPYHFDFAVDTFDPTSPYYPSWITYEWLLDNIGTEAEALINERCHLATNSPFTSPAGTPRYVLYGLAAQEKAAGALSPQINYYNNPVIDGEELYPNTVKYAGVSGGGAGGPLAFNISPMDARYLETLLDEADDDDPVRLRGMAIGSSTNYSAANPLRTLIAEIPGEGPAAEERIPLLAHVQEPGACDNASGVGTQLEIARALVEMIDDEALPAPKRTFTFIWGAELMMAKLWKHDNKAAFDATVAALVLDMVGEDPSKTGGPMRIEKMPDPASVYQYGLDELPGLEPEPVDAYVRLPDLHSLWGMGTVRFWPYPGHFLNDLYFRSADLVNEVSPEYEIGSNPWEGGSDHDSFIWNEDKDGYDPKPAALTWHFTDYVYHSSMDTMDKVSKVEERDVALTTVNVGYLLAIADEPQAAEILGIVQNRARWRFDHEMTNSAGSLQWAYDRAVADGATRDEVKTAVAEALALEVLTLTDWGRWYEEAVLSPSALVADPSAEYVKMEAVAARDVQVMTALAVANAEEIAAELVAGL
ncbi:MAG: M28 family peptidase [Thermoleophilia bacterium]|jgi:hypothetical protein|nr:M28 family peptidase [Thermoleophilia bacterium]